METRIVLCKKLEKELPGLERPPFPGPLGEEIFNSISAEAWASWQDLEVRIINEYRLNMGDKKDYETLLTQMRDFLNLS